MIIERISTEEVRWYLTEISGYQLDTPVPEEPPKSSQFSKDGLTALHSDGTECRLYEAILGEWVSGHTISLP